MDDGLKKRLLGAAVLASLAVIFLPMLFEAPDTAIAPMREVPPAPQTPFASGLLEQAPVAPRPAPAPPQPTTVPLAVATPARPGGPGRPVRTPPLAVQKAPLAPTLPLAGQQRPPAGKPQQLDHKAATPVPVVPETHAKLTAWIVQVGSFSRRDNALELAEKLRKAGFQTPDPDLVQVRGESLYRVRVGPVVEQWEAQALLPKVDRVTGTKAVVQRYP